MDPKLYQAVISGDHSLFEDLKRAGSYNYMEHVTSGHRNSILHIAVKGGQMEMAETIIDLCPSLLHLANFKGDSPLHIAARLGNSEISQLLISHAKVIEVEVEKELLRMQNAEKDTALHDAVRNGHFKVVNLLIKEDPELAQFVNCYGESLLFLAVDKKFYKIARDILEAATLCSYVGRNGMNVLHATIIRADKNFVYEVLKRCPTVTTEADSIGWTPLHYAAHLGNAGVVELLLCYDESLAYKKDKEGIHALHIAAHTGHDDVVRKIIANCPDTCELLDNRGRTALHVAAEHGKISVVKILLLLPGVRDLLNEGDEDGNTPFHLATIQENYGVLLELANSKTIDTGARNKAGLTAFDIMKSRKAIRALAEARFIRELGPRGLLIRSLEQGARRIQSANSNGEGQPQQTERLDVKTNKVGERLGIRKDWTQRLKETGAVNLVVATIIASVTFGAVLNMPGGYYSDNDHQGMAILSKKSCFGVFLIANSLAFGLSTASIFLHFRVSIALRENVARFFLQSAVFLNCSSIFALAVAFLAGTYVVLDTSPRLAVASVVTGCCFIMGPLLISFRSIVTNAGVERVYITDKAKEVQISTNSCNV